MVILTSLGTWGLPQMIHKFYTIRSEKAIATGTVISTLFAIVISGAAISWAASAGSLTALPFIMEMDPWLMIPSYRPCCPDFRTC